MAKETKAAVAANTGAPAAQSGAGIDINLLTPEQLAKLQKQLKEKKKIVSNKKDERFVVIDSMLKVKTEDKSGFKHTTRDILNALVDAGLVDVTVPDYATIEIKKIQARKQFLEKSTDKAGKLIHPPNTFGYAPSVHLGFNIGPDRVTKWFEDPKNVVRLNEVQIKIINKALSA